METLPETLHELNDSVTEQGTLVETLQRKVAGQVRDQTTRHDANTGAMSFLFDDHTEKIENTTTSVVAQARTQFSNWLELKNGKMELQVRDTVKDQVASHIETAKKLFKQIWTACNPLRMS